MVVGSHDGIGRHGRFKICWPCGCEGSTPSVSTGCSPPGFRGHCQPTSRCFGGGRAGWVLSVVNAPVWVAVAKSSMTVCKMGVVGKGGTCCFMCVVGVVVCGGCAFWGAAGVII